MFDTFVAWDWPNWLRVCFFFRWECEVDRKNIKQTFWSRLSRHGICFAVSIFWQLFFFSGAYLACFSCIFYLFCGWVKIIKGRMIHAPPSIVCPFISSDPCNSVFHGYPEPKFWTFGHPFFRKKYTRILGFRVQNTWVSLNSPLIVCSNCFICGNQFESWSREHHDFICFSFFSDFWSCQLNS